MPRRSLPVAMTDHVSNDEPLQRQVRQMRCIPSVEHIPCVAVGLQQTAAVNFAMSASYISTVRQRTPSRRRSR